MTSIAVLVPLRSPEIERAFVIDYSAIHIKWQRLSQRFARGILGGYRVYIKDTSSERVTNVTVGPDKQELYVTGLQGEKYYEIWINAFTSKGEGKKGYSQWIQTSKYMYT